MDQQKKMIIAYAVAMLVVISFVIGSIYILLQNQPAQENSDVTNDKNVDFNVDKSGGLIINGGGLQIDGGSGSTTKEGIGDSVKPGAGDATKDGATSTQEKITVE